MTRSIAKSTSGQKAVLAEHVEAIRSLGKQTIANVIEIGRRLAECKKMVGHKNFGCWLDREFGWSERTAQRFMSIHELAEAKCDKLSDLDLPISALYLLAAPSTPAPARDEILERAKAGEKIKHAEVAEAKPEWTKSLRDRRRPPPCEFDLRIVHEPTHIFHPGSSGDAYKSTDIRGRKPPRRRSNSKSRDVGTCGPFLSEAVAFTDAVNSGGEQTRAAVFPPAQSDALVRLQARIGELENDKRQLELKNIGLESEIEEARKPVSVVEGDGHHCTFCHRNQHEVFFLISAPAETAFVCDECIDLGANLVRERRAKAADEKLPLKPAEAAAKELATTPQADDGLDIPPYLDRTKSVN